MTKAGRSIPKLPRRQHSREPRRRFIIICEGKNTEPAYFGALKSKLPDVLIDIKPAAGVPMTIAETAAQLVPRGKPGRVRRDSYEEHDEIWAVFDRDEHQRYDEAVSRCETKGIKTARSNPCFELWLILHVSEFDKPDSRGAVQAHLEALCPEYDSKRGKKPDCSRFITQVEFAEKRAEKQLRGREDEGDPFGPPSTTVFQLTRAIRQASALSRGDAAGR
jgi:hypothetical protein